MKVLFDTNIVLDVLLDRKPFSDSAAYLFSSVERTQISGYLCATTVTTIHYLVRKAMDNQTAVKQMQQLLSLFEIAPVNRVVIEQALQSSFSDFEDAVLYESARHAGVTYIVTRNVSDFSKSKLPVFNADEFIYMLNSLEE
ncbi:MAG: PIN domain-containing protein [Gammaproteobacteria bacterium]|nr:MAG: PIN domain-containing protein [Gammaproteobacteria bacterium]